MGCHVLKDFGNSKVILFIFESLVICPLWLRILPNKNWEVPL